MSKHPSDQKPRGGKGQDRTTEQDTNKKQHEQHREGEPMSKKQAGQKFVSDEDIKKRPA